LIARRSLEEQLLAGLQAKVVHPDVIAYTLDRFEAELKRALDLRHSDADARRRQEAAIEKKSAISRLRSQRAIARRRPWQTSRGLKLNCERSANFAQLHGPK
jgi:hypothetical protein